MNKENLTIEPLIKYSRKRLVSMFFIGLLLLFIAELILPLRKPNMVHSIPYNDVFFYVVALLVFLYVLTRKFVHSIVIDYENRTLKFYYFTLLIKNSERLIYFDNLKVNYTKKITRSGSEWILVVFDKDKKFISFQDGKLGFDKERIEALIQGLEGNLVHV